MKRLSVFLYGAFSYGLFLAVFLYAIAFVADAPVPKTIDRGAQDTAMWLAVLINTGLLSLFAVQHSGMARRGFKRWVTRFIPKAMERSTFVMASNAVMILLFWQWRPIDMVIWQTGGPAATAAVYGVQAFGWAMVLTSTFLINHFDLFGLRQVVLYLRRMEYRPVGYRTPFLYRLVRHPLMLGFLIAFWSAPTMTVGHLMFALTVTGYILVALQLEERDLLAEHGGSYATYRKRVPMLLPWPRPHAAAATMQPAE